MPSPDTTPVPQALRSLELQLVQEQAARNGSEVLVFTRPFLDKSGRETMQQVETVVVDDEFAVQSIAGKPAVRGEWRSREQTVLVLGDGEPVRFTLHGQRIA